MKRREGQVWRHRSKGQHALIVSSSEDRLLGAVWEARWLESLDEVRLLELSLAFASHGIVVAGRLVEPTWERVL